MPSTPWNTTCTRSDPFAPALWAKKRTQGSRRLTGSGELAADAPGPSWSACVPGPETYHGSFAATIEALPFSVHAVEPFSKPRFGKAQYASGSLHGLNGYDFAPHEGRREPRVRRQPPARGARSSHDRREADP